jgi:hypothetical protein
MSPSNVEPGVDQAAVEAAQAIADGVTQAAVDAGHFDDVAERTEFTRDLFQRLLWLYHHPDAKSEPRNADSCLILQLAPKPGHKPSQVALISPRGFEGVGVSEFRRCLRVAAFAARVPQRVETGVH